jgi:hypothetical protein
MNQANTDAIQKAPGLRRFLLPSIGDVVFVIIFSVALILGAGLTHRDGDFAKHLRVGQTILEEGRLPTVDVYSHTMTGGEMVPYEWLAQTAFAATERWFGFDGLGVLTALVSAAPWAILYRWLIKRGTPIFLSVVLALLGAAASMIHWAARPHMFTWLFVVVWVILLEDLRRGNRAQVWALLPLAMIWVNTHGGFIVGYILIGTYLFGSLVNGLLDNKRDRGRDYAIAKHLSIVLVGTVAFSFVNPRGFQVVAHPFLHLLGDDFLFDFTREFNSPDFHNLFFWPFLAMILLTVLLSFRWHPTTLLLAAFWTLSGLYSFRNIPLYALVLTPIIADAVTPLWRAIRLPTVSPRWRELAAMERNVVGGSLSIVLIAFTMFSMTRSADSAYQFSQPPFPVEAVETVEESLPGSRVFNQFIWGGYLVYCCHPHIPVFIDGQTDYYGPELTREYDRAIRGLPEWREVFRDHGIDWVLISPETGLAQVLAEAGDWVESYRDETAVVFVPSS